MKKYKYLLVTVIILLNSVQLAGPNRIKVGMNSEEAKENHQLLLNTIHWLDGKLDDKN